MTDPQRIALLPDAIVVIKLEDVSRPDAPSIVIVEQRITTDGQQVPIPFKLVYDSTSSFSRETRKFYA